MPLPSRVFQQGTALNMAYMLADIVIEGDIISSSPITINFHVYTWDDRYFDYSRGFSNINIKNTPNIYTSAEWYVNDMPTLFTNPDVYMNFPVTFNNSSIVYNIQVVFYGISTHQSNGYDYQRGMWTYVDVPFYILSGVYSYTYNKLSTYALPQSTYQIENLNTKVNFSVEVKQYINPIPNTYNLGDIASDSNNIYWIVARDNTGSSVWKSINIRDLYNSSLVYNLGDLIVNPDDSIDVMYRTDNIWKRIGTLKI